MVYLEPYAVVDYNLTLSRLKHIYHGQPFNRVDLNHMPESQLYPPVRDLGFGLCIRVYNVYLLHKEKGRRET
jgi:hypothetical protein